VQIATLRDLVAEGATAATETDPDVARLKGSADLVQAIETAVRFYENPPAKPMTGRRATPWPVRGGRLSVGGSAASGPRRRRPPG